MRAILILTIGTAALGACMMAAPPDDRMVAEGQAKFAAVTAGKVAGAPITCLPPRISSRNLVVIDPATIAYEDSSRRVYVNHLRGECNLHPGFNSLVVRSSGSGTCSGDIADVADIRTGMTYGSCALGEFVPYTRP